MRTKVTLVLILLNVALFFFIFKFERAWRTEDAMREARRRVLGSETADIRSLTVTSAAAGGPAFSLARTRGVWLLTRPLDWPANENAVRSMLQELQFLENETSFSAADLAKSGQSLADFGLDKPRVTVTFTSSDGGATVPGGGAGPTTVLRLGDTTKVGNRLYVLSPDGARIHVVNRSLLDALSVPIDQLRADTLLTIQVFEAKALSVQTSGARVRIARRAGSGRDDSDRDANRWMFDTIVNARASKTELDLTINALNALHAASFPSSPPAVLPSVSPSLRVTIDGNSRSETLLLGEPVKPAAGGLEAGAVLEGATEYFAQLMNGNTVRAPVFTVAVPNRLLETLRRAQKELREPRILDFDSSAVTAITIAAPNLPPLTLQRLDANAAESSWQLVRGVAGAAGPQTQVADPQAVRRLLERLTLLSAVQFESDAPSSAQTEAWGFNRPEREITLAATAAPGSTARPILLQLGTDTAGAVFARAGLVNEMGASVYAVSVDPAREFPIDPKAWRDRTLRTLPPTARIAALKLTDLMTRQPVFETTFDAAGKPSREPRDAAALGNVVAGLRTLRARRFVQEGVPDRILIAGEDRMWRYELQVSVVLPAAGAEQTSTHALLVTERVGGDQQLAASREFDVVFELEQPMVDALWRLAYGSRDPGPQPEKK